MERGQSIRHPATSARHGRVCPCFLMESFLEGIEPVHGNRANVRFSFIRLEDAFDLEEISFLKGGDDAGELRVGCHKEAFHDRADAHRHEHAVVPSADVDECSVPGHLLSGERLNPPVPLRRPLLEAFVRLEIAGGGERNPFRRPRQSRLFWGAAIEHERPSPAGGRDRRVCGWSAVSGAGRFSGLLRGRISEEKRPSKEDSDDDHHLAQQHRQKQIQTVFLDLEKARHREQRDRGCEEKNTQEGVEQMFLHGASGILISDGSRGAESVSQLSGQGKTAGHDRDREGKGSIVPEGTCLFGKALLDRVDGFQFSFVLLEARVGRMLPDLFGFSNKRTIPWSPGELFYDSLTEKGRRSRDGPAASRRGCVGVRQG